MARRSCVYCGYDIVPLPGSEAWWVTDDSRGESWCRYSTDTEHHPEEEK